MLVAENLAIRLAATNDPAQVRSTAEIFAHHLGVAPRTNLTIEPVVPGMAWSVTMIFTSARERAEKGECLLGRAGAGDAGFAQHGFADASCVWLSSIKRT